MKKRRAIAGAVLVALLLGVAGYAWFDAGFAARLKDAAGQSSSWVRQTWRAAGAAIERSAAYAAYRDALREHAVRSQQRQQARDQRETERAAPAARVAPAAPAPAGTPRARPPASLGQRIAGGHAFAKHGHEFGFASEAQLAAHIDRVIATAGPANAKRLIRGRSAYWDERSGTVVIVDPNSADGGTAFRPGRGRKYFESLR